MKTETLNIDDLVKTLETVRREVAQLSERLAALEMRTVDPLRPVAETKKPVPNVPAISEETLLVISAAIAGFLGVKPHIRQIRLLESAPWVQQGRVTIQAGHTLPVRYG